MSVNKEIDLEDISEKIIKQWDYLRVESGYGKTINTFTPCKLEFEDYINTNVNKFHYILNKKGYESVNNLKYKITNKSHLYYDGQIQNKENENAYSILLYDGNCIRIYPINDFVPTIKEMTNFLTALSEGFDSNIVDCDC